MDITQLIALPPQMAWLGWLLGGIAVLTALLLLGLSVTLLRQNPPSLEILEQRLQDLPPRNVSKAAWPLRAAATAQALLAVNQTVTAESCLEAVEQDAVAPTLFVRALIGLFVLLGLGGTVWGLFTAVQSLLPTLQQAQNATDIKDLISSLSGTLSSLGNAFRITLFGIAPTIVFSFWYGWYAFRLERKMARIRLWLNTEAIPLLHAQHRADLAAHDPTAQVTALLGETRQYLTNWKTGMEAIGRQTTASLATFKMVSQSADSLKQTAIEFGTAADKVKAFLEASEKLTNMTAELTTLAASMHNASENMGSEIGKVDATLKDVTTAVNSMAAKSETAHTRFLERNNLLVTSLQTQFTGWSGEQKRIADDLNRVLTRMTEASKDYTDMLTQTKTAVLDTAGLQHLITQTVASLRDWQQQLETLDATYQQAQHAAAKAAPKKAGRG